jgi:hypothetical protein
MISETHAGMMWVLFLPLCARLSEGLKTNRMRPTSFFMTELEKISRFDQIKDLLDSMDKDDQRLIVWSHLKYLLALDKHGIGWLLERVGELIDSEEKSLLSPLQ